MADQLRTAYDAYARQRLYRVLLDMQVEDQNLNWSGMAEEIYLSRGIKFQRINFYRLRDGTLSDANVDIIVTWLESEHDSEIRTKLTPQSIFDEVGRSSRDYYFHIPSDNFADEWEEGILEQFSGVYLCAPANDKNTFIPQSKLRQWFADSAAVPEFERKGRSLDMKQYIQERSILILQATKAGYFYASEFPLSLLFPRTFESLDVRMVYEGIGIASSNSIQVQLRECLARVPKTHSILISTKSNPQTNNPFGLSLYLPPGTEGVKKEWQSLTPEEREQLKHEYESSIEDDHYLAGPSQISVSPLPNLKNRVTMTFAREMVYHRKPADVLRQKQVHFIRPEFDNEEEIEKILANPLTIGELL